MKKRSVILLSLMFLILIGMSFSVYGVTPCSGATPILSWFTCTVVEECSAACVSFCGQVGFDSGTPTQCYYNTNCECTCYGNSGCSTCGSNPVESCNGLGSGSCEDSYQTTNGHTCRFVASSVEDSYCTDSGVGDCAGCTPDCDGKECGDDGCGGVCNGVGDGETTSCTVNYGTCQETGTKTCSGTIFGSCTGTTDPRIATCAGKECGDDGCGGVCGTCTVGTCINGQCCGDNGKDTGETCDGTDLSPYSSDCSSHLDYTGGTLSCLADCSNYDFSACTNCVPTVSCNDDCGGAGTGYSDDEGTTCFSDDICTTECVLCTDEDNDMYYLENLGDCIGEIGYDYGDCDDDSVSGPYVYQFVDTKKDGDWDKYTIGPLVDCVGDKSGDHYTLDGTNYDYLAIADQKNENNEDDCDDDEEFVWRNKDLYVDEDTDKYSFGEDTYEICVGEKNAQNYYYSLGYVVSIFFSGETKAVGSGYTIRSTSKGLDCFDDGTRECGTEGKRECIGDTGPIITTNKYKICEESGCWAEKTCDPGVLCYKGYCLNCRFDSSCDDDDPCTTDACISGICQHSSNSAPCDDGIFCTTNDVCNAGVCDGTVNSCDDSDACTTDECSEGLNDCTNQVEPSCPCTVNGDCDDGNPCTDDSCVENECEYTYNAGPCDDGLYCTVNDICSNGDCITDERDCDDSIVCTIDSCDDDLDSCVVDDTLCGCEVDSDCNDFNSCTDDECVNNNCQNTNDDNNFCSDNNWCTTNDQCLSGVCTGTTNDCDDGDACTTDICNSFISECFYKNTCTCTVDGDCDDGNICTDDTCNAGTCEYADNTNGCDDSQFCTVNDICSDGTCVGDTKSCDDGNIYTIDTCSEDTDACVNIPQSCNVNADCNDGDDCTDDSCVEGDCSYTYNTAPCNDGLFCTENGQCSNGVCISSEKTCDDSQGCSVDTCSESQDRCVFDTTNCPCVLDGDCDDGNPCTDDTCVGNLCTVTNDNSNTCDDGFFCTETDSCVSGVCVGAAKTCTDGIACTDDFCNDASNTCETDQFSCLLNGEIDSDEDCDGTNLGGETCISQGYVGGTLGCTWSGTFDTSDCDECDGVDLNGETCESLSYISGTLSCGIDNQFDTSNCNDCDGANLDGESCESLGYLSGTLSCTGEGTFDTSDCDECDGTNFNGETCISQGFVGGALSCTVEGKFDTSNCDVCDGNNLDGETCESLGYLGGGILTCDIGGTFNTEQCLGDGPTVIPEFTTIGLILIALSSIAGIFIIKRKKQ